MFSVPVNKTLDVTFEVTHEDFNPATLSILLRKSEADITFLIEDGDNNPESNWSVNSILNDLQQEVPEEFEKAINALGYIQKPVPEPSDTAPETDEQEATPSNLESAV